MWYKFSLHVKVFEIGSAPSLSDSSEAAFIISTQNQPNVVSTSVGLIRKEIHLDVDLRLKSAEVRTDRRSVGAFFFHFSAKCYLW